MRSGKNLAILFLLVTTVTGGAVAWLQHQELVVLRASAVEVEQPVPHQTLAAPVEFDDHHFADEVASAPITRPGNTPQSAPPSFTDRGPSGDQDARRARMREMMERPEVQQLMAIQQKSALDSRYAALFRNLSLSPEQLERFKGLLVEKNTAVGDIRSAAREQGMNGRGDREALSKLVAETQADIDQGIREAIGESGFAQYENFEKTLPQRNVANQLERRLSYSSTPLSPQQTEQLVSILASTAQPASGNANPRFPNRYGGHEITDATINQALGVLAGPQVDALRQIQREQQAQSALNATLRNRSAANPPPATAGPNSSTSRAVTSRNSAGPSR